MILDWQSTTGELILNGDYERLIVLEQQRQVLLLGKRTFWVIDLNTFEVLHMQALDTVKVYTAVVDVQKHCLYIGTEYGHRLIILDLHTYQKTTFALKHESQGLALSQKYRKLYSIGSDTTTILSLKDRTPSVIRIARFGPEKRGLGLTLSPNGQTLAVGRDGQGELYRADSYSFKTGFPLPEGARQLLYSPDGVLLASAGGTIHSPRLPDGTFDLDRRDEATWADTQVAVWNSDSGQLLYQSEAQESSVRRLAWHPTLPVLASTTGLRGIQLWQIPESGSQLQSAGELDLPPYHSDLRDLIFTSDGHHLLALCQRGLTEYRLEGTASLKHRPAPTYMPEATISTPIFHPENAIWRDGQLWISNQRQWAAVDPFKPALTRESELDEHAYLLNIIPQQGSFLRLRASNTQADRIELWSLDGHLLQSFRAVPRASNEHLRSHGFAMRLDERGEVLSFGQYGRLFRVAWAAPGEVQSAAFEEEEHFSQFFYRAPIGLALSTAGAVSPTVRLWNTETLASMVVLEEGDLASFSGRVVSLHLNEGGLLALGTSQGEVGLFHLATGQFRMRGIGHGEGTVHDLDFSPDDTLLASAADDRSVRLWDIATGSEVAAFHHGAPVHQVRFAPQENRLVSVDEHGTVSVWSLDGIAAWRDLSSPTVVPPTVDDHASVKSVQTLPLPPTSSEGVGPDVDARLPYLERASLVGLKPFAGRSWVLYRRSPFELAPRQSATHLVLAYQEARQRAQAFQDALQDFGTLHGAQVRTRPTRVKDANRSIEKMLSQPSVIPADLLAGTLIAASVQAMYVLAEHLHGAFEVVSFRDRMITRVSSGYGDLQFQVLLDGHLAEVKVVHRLFHEIDRYEHRLYEIQRTMDVEHPDELPVAEEIVGEALLQASRRMYTQAWTWIQTAEGGTW